MGQVPGGVEGVTKRAGAVEFYGYLCVQELRGLGYHEVYNYEDTDEFDRILSQAVTRPETVGDLQDGCPDERTVREKTEGTDAEGW